MIGELLHNYDLDLADYVLGNVRQHLDERPFAQWVKGQVRPPALLQYLLDGGRADLEQERLLLNDSELQALTVALDGALEVDRKWLPDEALHRRHVETIREVRDGLTRQAAEDWSRACARFARRLEGERLLLPAGIEIVQDWLWHLRRLLKALGAADFLPCPQGRSPTPTQPGPPPASAPAWQAPQDQQEENLARMQRAIAELGPDAKADDLIRNACIARKPGRDALRALQQRGEYQGFARRRPYRYQEGRAGGG